MSNTFIAIIIGPDSGLPAMQATIGTFKIRAKRAKNAALQKILNP